MPILKRKLHMHAYRGKLLWQIQKIKPPLGRLGIKSVFIRDSTVNPILFFLRKYNFSVKHAFSSRALFIVENIH